MTCRDIRSDGVMSFMFNQFDNLEIRDSILTSGELTTTFGSNNLRMFNVTLSDFKAFCNLFHVFFLTSFSRSNNTES